MTRTVLIGLIGLVLWTAPAQAADKADLDFVTRASNGNLVALAESRLALDRADDPKIKAFARQLLEDHGKAEARLQNAAESSGVAVPTTLDPDHQARLEAVQSRSGAAFDTAYVADQVEVHSNALTLFADYMLLGDNPALKTLAIAMIPITEAQYKSAQALSRH